MSQMDSEYTHLHTSSGNALRTQSTCLHSEYMPKVVFNRAVANFWIDHSHWGLSPINHTANRKAIEILPSLACPPFEWTCILCHCMCSHSLLAVAAILLSLDHWLASSSIVISSNRIINNGNSPTNHPQTVMVLFLLPANLCKGVQCSINIKKKILMRRFI